MLSRVVVCITCWAYIDIYWYNNTDMKYENINIWLQNVKYHRSRTLCYPVTLYNNAAWLVMKDTLLLYVRLAFSFYAFLRPFVTLTFDVMFVIEPWRASKSGLWSIFIRLCLWSRSCSCNHIITLLLLSVWCLTFRHNQLCNASSVLDNHTILPQPGLD